MLTTIGPFDHLGVTSGDSLTLNPLAAMRLDAAREAFNRRDCAALAAVTHRASCGRRCRTKMADDDRAALYRAVGEALLVGRVVLAVVPPAQNCG